ncbi:MAG: hypothetical protein M3Q14_02795 [bacterium]|nr:hypothetical protein [bacterium]
MGDNPLLTTINEITESITQLPAIGSVGLDSAESKEKIILEMHNHLGNVRQMVEASTEAFNGTEQFLILKNAQKELTELGSRLFEAHQINMVNDDFYNSIDEKMHTLQDLISDTVDPEYL